MIWFFFIVLIWVDHHSFHFLIIVFHISSPFSKSSFHFLFISYILIYISNSIPSSLHSHVSLKVWPLILSLVSPSTFPLVAFRSMAHDIFSMHYILYMKVWVWSLGTYLSLVSLHFFHPTTLTYITSRVISSPWGHEIRCYLWQPLLRLVFGIWLIYRRRPISSSGRCFFDVWRWFSDGCRRLLHFMDDIWCHLASHSTVHQLSYWGTFLYWDYQFFMVYDDSVVYLCCDASSGVSPKLLCHAHTFWYPHYSRLFYSSETCFRPYS